MCSAASATMLQAVESHPAMLVYLDNAQSFGPNSTAGRNRKRGLNENLAREILELHTLGVDGGYTQADVTALARIITGWTFVGREGRLGEPGTFAFFPNGHEPGDHTLLGKVYRAGGVEQGEAALADLARHPATARHIAAQARAPFRGRRAAAERWSTGWPRCSARPTATSGAGPRAGRADEAWAGAARARCARPSEFLLAALRAIDRMPEDPGALLGPLGVDGHAAVAAAGPQRLARYGCAWASPKGMKSRLDVSAAIAAQA